jgi:diaminohydroxyphosphoribosylaminopyrimidine deaminase / 5-amino-6-(5-phosphoribosylamino)uracil reductase
MSTRKDKFNPKDRYFMNLALNLAREHYGLTGDNPSVGCVIVKNDQVISLGKTSINGRPHAEYNAIKNSKNKCNGSKMYVTLEPCNHYGKTSPCTNLIIKNKIKEVVYSIIDIDNRTSGKTSKILKSKKIKVKKGLLYKEVKNFYKSYFVNKNKKIPFVTGKLAISKNYLIYSKKNKKITNNYSDNISHLLRYKNDSILISYKTLNKDNPKLNCRINGLEQFSPTRIIIDKNLKLKINSYIVNTSKHKKTIIFYNNENRRKINFLIKKGIKLIKLNVNKENQFDLKLLLKKIYYLGSRNLLVEGGKGLSLNFFNNKLFNQFYLFKSFDSLFKFGDYKEFNPLKYLSKNFKNKLKINTYLDKNMIYLYRN